MKVRKQDGVRDVVNERMRTWTNYALIKVEDKFDVELVVGM